MLRGGWIRKVQDGALAVSNDEKIAWKSYQEKLLNTEFERDRNNLFLTDTVRAVSCFLQKDMVKGKGHDQKDEEKKGCKAIRFSVRNGKGSRSWDDHWPSRKSHRRFIPAE